MSNKLKGSTKFAPNTLRNIRKIAEPLIEQVMLDGLKQYTVAGIVEAKWKIAGIANLLKRIGDEETTVKCIMEANKLENLLDMQTLRAEVWQNLKEAEEVPDNVIELPSSDSDK
jgi:hypothetical protein